MVATQLISPLTVTLSSSGLRHLPVISLRVVGKWDSRALFGLMASGYEPWDIAQSSATIHCCQRLRRQGLGWNHNAV